MSDNGQQSALPPFPPGFRASGLLLHVTSLPSPYGIGDVGPEALAWVDRLQEPGKAGGKSLPLGPTGYGNSPYQSLSSFAGNWLLISPDGLIEDGLLQPGEAASMLSFPEAAVDYDAVVRSNFDCSKRPGASFDAGAGPGPEDRLRAIPQ